MAAVSSIDRESGSGGEERVPGGEEGALSARPVGLVGRGRAWPGRVCATCGGRRRARVGPTWR
jgi:hypothetical protein